MTVIQVL